MISAPLLLLLAALNGALHLLNRGHQEVFQ